LTAHNLHYYQSVMSGLRLAIEEDALDAFADAFQAEQAVGSAASERM
jgi:queuine tRNA-ribosyltransferase